MIAYHPTVAISRKEFDRQREEIRIYKTTDAFKRKLEEIKNEKTIYISPSSSSIGDNLGIVQFLVTISIKVLITIKMLGRDVLQMLWQWYMDTMIEMGKIFSLH